MTNLLRETRDVLAGYGYTANDIKFIGSTDSGHSCIWKEFESLANFEYNSGYGAQEVASDLKIILQDGSYLIRWEYDGSEGWELIKEPSIPTELKKIKSLGGGDAAWKTLSELN